MLRVMLLLSLNADVSLAVQNVLENPSIKVLSPSKRYDACSVADIELGMSSSIEHSTVTYHNGVPAIENVANNANIKVGKRGGCDVVGLDVILKDVLENLNVSVLSPSKRGKSYSVADIAVGM